jgi:hypothetical protein
LSSGAPQDVVVPPGARLSVGQLHSSLVAGESESGVLDLRRAVWVEPIGLVMLAALAEGQARLDRTLRLIAPAEPSIARYLARMRLGQVLEELGHEHELPQVRSWDTGSELAELRRFEGVEEPDRLGLVLFDKTAADRDVATALHQSVAEVGVNVPEHSERSGGYLAAQSTSGGSVVQFAIGDSGRGIAASFTDLPGLSDADGLDLALRQGRSRIPEPGRGRGLRKTQALVHGMGGSMHMISGNAFRTEHRRSSTAGTASAHYGGTLLQATFPVPS